MKDRKLFNLLQINGGTFPTGGFSQSWGLETYVADGVITDADTFGRFMKTYLTACIGRCEGPIICRAYELAECGEKDEIRELELLSNASKVTKESKEAGIRMGKAFVRIMLSVLDDDRLEKFTEILGTKEISYPVAYGYVCRLMDVPIEEAIAAYVYSTANTLVQSAVKLVPLGNTEAQKVLYMAEKLMENVTELSLATELENITNFCPGIDIASIRHESLPVRLYMS